METALFNSIIKDGAFAGLFVFLLLYVLKTSKQREEKYQEIIEVNQKIINHQAENFTTMSNDVSEIKQAIKKLSE